MNVYQKGDIWVEGEYPAILAIGDSWFWYPDNNLLQSISRHKQLRSDYSNIQALGFSGARLEEYVMSGTYAADVQNFLSPANRNFFNVFMISGAGNDAVKYDLALRKDCRGIDVASDCIDPDGIDNFLRLIATAMGALIHEIRWAYKDETVQPRPIFINGYDNPVPDGRGFAMGKLKINGPWLKPALDSAGVKNDAPFRIAVVGELIKRLNVLLAQFHDPAQHVVFVKALGTLSTGANYQTDWANELHPTRSGFDKIADQHWIPELAKWGMCQ